MAAPKAVEPQTDFSAGHLNVDMKRSDNAIVKSGARQMINLRLRNSGRPQQRPGKRIQFIGKVLGRTDEVRVLPGVVYRLVFNGDGTLDIRNTAGAIVASSAGYLWVTSTTWQISWTLVRTGGTSSDVVILFPGQSIKLARFDGTNWSFPAFAFQLDSAGIPRAPFYRVSALGVTLVASGLTGVVTLNASGAVFLPTHVGTIFRYANRRLLITGVGSATFANATWLEPGFPMQIVGVTSITGHIGNPTDGFTVGEIVQGFTSNTQGEIVAIDAVGNFLYIQSINSMEGFSGAEDIVGANTSATANSVVAAPMLGSILTWDEQIISNARGWPRSCSTDQGRLILCDLPAVPEAVIWSALGQPYDMQVGAEATNAMVEIISGKPRVYHVVAGDGGEIVFTDRGIYYVPINETNPLKPGSVVFRDVSPEAASQVRPVRVAEGMLYVNAGRNRVVAILGSGSSFSVKPYDTVDISRYHYDLFTSPNAIAVSTGDGTYPERYIYVANTDGSMIVGRFELTEERKWVGWTPWTSQGGINWVSALGANVTITDGYLIGAQNVSLVETVDDTTYLDATELVNALPAALTPPGGKGPLWWAPGGSVFRLVDGVKDLGDHTTDANGFIIPIGGEDLTSPTLMAGLLWLAALEPFIPQAQGGQSVGQRMKRRRTARLNVSVENSTGFVLAKLYSGPQGALLPAPGAIIQTKRIPPYNQGDNAAAAPPIRERTYTFRPTGRSFDPRVAIIKDTPGPIRVLELGFDVTV